MTKRSELAHRRAELKEQIMTWVANRLFSFRETGVDGFLKRKLLKPKTKKTRAQAEE